MPVVPFTQRREPEIPDWAMPGPTQIAMATAEVAMQKEQERIEDQRKRLEASGLKDVEVGDDWNELIPYGGKLLDPTKLSPKQLKDLDIKY